MNSRQVDFVLTGPAEEVVFRSKSRAVPVIGWQRQGYFGQVVVMADLGLKSGTDYQPMNISRNVAVEGLIRGDIAAVGMNFTHLQKIRKAFPDHGFRAIARGVGIELKVAMDLFSYDLAATIILAVFALVIAVEQIGARLRARIIQAGGALRSHRQSPPGQQSVARAENHGQGQDHAAGHRDHAAGRQRVIQADPERPERCQDIAAHRGHRGEQQA